MNPRHGQGRRSLVRPFCLAAAALVLLGTVLPSDAAAQLGRAAGANYVLTADEVTFDDTRGLYEAVGNVRIVQSDGQTLSADWVTYGAESGVGVATGNVRIVDGPQVVEAGFAALNLNSGISVAGQATLDSSEPGFIVEGDSIQRTGVNRYRVEYGRFTACRCPPKAGDDERLPWEVEVREADVEIGGYGVAKHLWFKTLGFPVAYLPWVIFPAKTERQTGFLLPSYGTSSRSGLEFELPFFWAAAPNLGLIAREKLMGRRGLKHSLTYEYLFGEGGWSEGGLAVLPSDNKVDRDDPETRYSNDRWALWLRHEQSLGPGIRIGLDVKEVSDNDYVIDFRDLTRGVLEQEGARLRTEQSAPGLGGVPISVTQERESSVSRHARFLESSGWYSYARDALYAGVELSLVDDLPNPNDLDRDDFFLQRLPELRISTLPRALAGTPLRLSVESRYDYFYQAGSSSRVEEAVLSDPRLFVDGLFFDTGQDGLFDTHEPDSDGRFLNIDQHGDNAGPGRRGDQFSQGDGLYQEGELLADYGHRFDLYPRAYLPHPVGIVETLSEIGYRETLYFPKHGSSERRGVWTGRFEARTRFAKELGLGGGVRHVLEPRLGFAFLSTPSQKRNPLFIPASTVRLRRLIDGDLRILTRNPSDRLPDERFLLFQLVNRFYSLPSGAGSGGRRVAEVRLGTGYDFEDEEWTRLFTAGSFAPAPRWRFEWDVGYDTEESELEDAELSLSFRGSPGNYLGLRYRYLRDSSVGFENFVRNDEVFGRFRPGSKVKQLNVNLEWAVSRRIRFFTEGYTTLESASNGSGRVGFVLVSECGCWDLIGAIEHETRPRETRFVVVLNLLGLGRRAKLLGYELEGTRDVRR